MGRADALRRSKRKLKRALPKGDPDRAGADGDPLRGEPEMDPLHDCIRSRIDARHGSGSRIGSPDRSFSNRDRKRVSAGVDDRVGAAGGRIETPDGLSSPTMTQTEPKPVATAPGEGPAGMSS